MTSCFGDLTVDLIDTEQVLKVLRPIWDHKPNEADRVRARIEAVLDVAKARGFRVGDNPARWKKHLSLMLPALSDVKPAEHYLSLPHTDISAFMCALHQHDCMSAHLLEWLILNAARPSAARGARRDEIKFACREWQIPAVKMKGRGRMVKYPRGVYRAPLSDSALALADRMLSWHNEAYLFPGERSGKPLHHSVFFALLSSVMGRRDVTAHGFRATFRTWADDRTVCEKDVKEMALGHSLGERTEEAYSRSDLFEKRRQLMNAWAEVVTSPADERKMFLIGTSDIPVPPGVTVAEMLSFLESRAKQGS
jgi:integrase